MGDIWCPFARRNEAPQHLWGPTQNPDTGLLHTTESSGKFWPADNTYFGHSYYPNTTITETDIWEHIPINRASRALKNLAGGVQTNHSGVMQIEIAWNAEDIRNLPKGTLNLLRRYMRWCEKNSRIPRVSTVEWVPYPESYGINARQRLKDSVWTSYIGWCGHQHADENDHGDPGNIDIDWLLADEEQKEEFMSDENLVELKKYISQQINNSVEWNEQRTERVVAAAVAKAIHENKQTELNTRNMFMANQKTAVLYRVKGSKAPWYGLYGGRVIGPLDFEQAKEFKQHHEITENSIEISEEWHAAYSLTTVNISDKSIDEIVDAVSRLSTEERDGV